MPNKTESYNGFSKWFSFGGYGIIIDNDREEQNKILKYNDLLSNAVILHNVIDISLALEKLHLEKINFSIEDIQSISPHMTNHIKRFGEYIVDLSNIPQPINLTDIEEIITQ